MTSAVLPSALSVWGVDTSCAGQTIADGPMLLALGLAMLGGLVSFASPCVLPLVPGYLGYVTGLAPSDATSGRGRMVAGATLFVIGFSIVFLLIGVTFTSVTPHLVSNREVLMRVGGVIVIVMAALFLGAAKGWSWMPSWRPAAGLGGALPLGAVFGLGMSACTGPTLGAIYALTTSLSGDEDLVRRGVVLGAAYSLGMGIPFILMAAGFAWAGRASRWIRNHHRVFQVIGGGVLLVVGLLMVIGVWDEAMTWLQVRWTQNFETVL